MGSAGGASSRAHALRRALVVVVATMAMVIGLLPVFSTGVLMPFVRDDTGVSTTFAGLLPTWLFAVAAAGSGVAGTFVDRFGPRLGMAGLFACASLAWFTASIASSVTGALSAMTFAGLAMATATPAATRLLFGTLRGKRLGLALGIAHSGTQLGAMFAGGLLPTIAIALGWRDAVRISALLPLIGLAIVSTPLVAFRSPDQHAAAGSSLSFRNTLRNTPGLVRLVLFAAILNAGVNAGVVYLPTYASSAFDLDLVAAGITTLVMGASSVVGKILWGAVRVGNDGRSALEALAILSGLGIILLLLAPSTGVAALWLGAAVFGFTATTWAVPTTREAAVRGGTLRSGSASGTVMIAGFAGGAVAPLAYGWVIDVSTFSAAWMSVIGLFAIAGMVIHGLSPRPASIQHKDVP